MAGSLAAVGIGINFSRHLTTEVKEALQKANKVLHLVGDPIAHLWLLDVCPGAESLYGYYSPEQDRMDSYLMMVERVLAEVRAGFDVAIVSYGHPGVFGFPMHESIRIARSEGFEAKMLPAISSIDCLFADLDIDPGADGCQIFEASDFLVNKRKFDDCCQLILLQVGVIGMRAAKIDFDPRPGLQVLMERLLLSYPEHHEVIIYEAAKYVVSTCQIDSVALRELSFTKVNAISTLFVPPLRHRESDISVMQQIGLD